jgi:predicted N-acyltransferase
MGKMQDTRSSKWLESDDEKYQVRFISSILDINAEYWNRCAGTENPFVSHEYLSALECSKTACKKTGFEPHHVVVADTNGDIVAAAPAYIKHHSEAELGADMGWSVAHDRMCGPYYPKLQVEVPMTAGPGNRFLIAPGQSRNELFAFLLKTLIGIVATRNLSSLHVNFVTGDELEFLEECGLSISHGYQFQWERNGQKNINDFLGSLKKSARYMIKRERREFLKTDLEFATLSGPTLTKEIMTEFYHLYLDTYKRYGGKEFLTPEFFHEIQKRLPANAILNTVRRKGKVIAATLLFHGKDMIYANHWGCREHIKFLHFEVTYYKAIDYCFAHNKNSINAGPGGNHKSNRGFLPFKTYHAHWFRSPEFQKAISRSIEKKKEMIEGEIEKAMTFSPFVDQKNDVHFHKA